MNARRSFPATAPLTEMEAAALLKSDLKKLSYAAARALLRRVQLDAHECTLQVVLVRRLILEPEAPFHHARTTLTRVLLMGRRSAPHLLNVILLLMQWHPDGPDAWREARIASLVLALSEAEWGEMNVVQYIAFRVWLHRFVAGRPAATGIALLTVFFSRTRTRYPQLEIDRWICDSLEQWRCAHAGHPVPAQLVHDLLLSREPRARALAYTVLGTHPVVSDDLASLEAR